LRDATKITGGRSASRGITMVVLKFLFGLLIVTLAVELLFGAPWPLAVLVGALVALGLSRID
jgi:hypothetical protein